MELESVQISKLELKYENTQDPTEKKWLKFVIVMLKATESKEIQTTL